MSLVRIAFIFSGLILVIVLVLMRQLSITSGPEITTTEEAEVPQTLASAPSLSGPRSSESKISNNQPLAEATGQSAGVQERVESLLEQGRPDDALELLEEASDPDSVWHHLMLSEVYLLNEDFPMAIGAADTVLELDPNCAEGYYQRAQARIGIEEYSEALDDIERFITLVDDPELRAHAVELQAAWSFKKGSVHAF